MSGEPKSQNSPEIPAITSSIRQEVLGLFKEKLIFLPELPEEELIALCELMQEVPSEEMSMRLLPKDFSIFFTEQDGKETSEIIRIAQAGLEYASGAQRPVLIRNLEVKIAQHITQDTKITLSLLTLLGVLSQYRTTNKVSVNLLQVLDQPKYSHWRDLDQPIDSISADFLQTFDKSQNQEQKYTSLFSPMKSLSVDAAFSLMFLFRINRPYANALLHKIFDFLEHHSSTLLASTRTTGDAWREEATRFRNLARSMGQMNENFLMHSRCEQMGRLFEGVDVRGGANFYIKSTHEVKSYSGLSAGEKVRYFDSSERYWLKHLAEEQKNTFLVGLHEGRDRAAPETLCFQLAPHYIAKYQGGNTSAIFYIPDEEYEALDKAIVDARAANKPEDTRRLQKYANQMRQMLNDPKRIVPDVDRFELREFFFDLDSPDVNRSFTISDQVKMQNNNEVLLLKNGFQTYAHRPIAKQDFFKKLFPGVASFDPALYDEYVHLMRPQMREAVEEFFGITLGDKPLWVTGNFLRFISQLGAVDITLVRNFIKRFGDDALISFLAVEGDTDFAADLVKIGSRFGKTAKPLLQKYAEIARTAYNAADYLRENFGHSAAAEPVVQLFIANLLARGKDLLRTFSDKKPKRILLNKLSAIDEQTAMICSGIAALKGERIALADVKPFRMHVFSTRELRDHPDDFASTLRKAYEENLKKDGYTPVDIEHLIMAFDEHINDSEDRSRFYVILREEKTPNPLIGFTVFTDTAPGKKFWSALTVESAYKRSGFYPSILMQALEYEAQDAVIRGKASALRDITASYIERAQFEGVDFYYDQEEQDGILTIERPIKKKIKLEFPSPIPLFLPPDISSQISAKQPLIAFEVSVRDLFEPRMLKAIFTPLEHGYALARYTKDAKHAQLAFEYRG